MMKTNSNHKESNYKKSFSNVKILILLYFPSSSFIHNKFPLFFSLPIYSFFSLSIFFSSFHLSFTYCLNLYPFTSPIAPCASFPPILRLYFVFHLFLLSSLSPSTIPSSSSPLLFFSSSPFLLLLSLPSP